MKRTLIKTFCITGIFFGIILMFIIGCERPTPNEQPMNVNTGKVIKAIEKKENHFYGGKTLQPIGSAQTHIPKK